MTGPALTLFGTKLPPNIRSLDLSSCFGATNEIELLLDGPVGNSLRHLDLTGTKADYSLVLRLYGRFPDLMIRRIPKWLGGRNTWSGHDEQIYYADGAVGNPDHPGFLWSLQAVGSEAAYTIQFIEEVGERSALESFSFRARLLSPGLVLFAVATWPDADPPEAFTAELREMFSTVMPGLTLEVTTFQGVMRVTKLHVTPLENEDQRPPAALLAEIQKRSRTHNVFHFGRSDRRRAGW
eukprot:TRINITY_DN14501_c0_g1_i1.p1 TRINITY_DN14501_c0_g1~~TRINITY_DN14501_c0_g1_i1.p1  ORF type:complete len:238 (-),score=25.81 TRINITY_DN14501_c0_g1_i1:114-827(-)